MRIRETNWTDFKKKDEYPSCGICNKLWSVHKESEKVKILYSEWGEIMFVCFGECDPRDFFRSKKMQDFYDILYGMDFTVGGKKYRCANFPKDGNVTLRDNSGQEISRDLSNLSVEIDGEEIKIF